MQTKALSLILALIMVVGIIPTYALPVLAKETADEITDLTSDVTDNQGDQNYTYWTSTTKSYLVDTNDGLMRVEYTSGEVIVEYYDNSFNLTRKLCIQAELSLFGGFYASDDAYYLAFGQTNYDEDDSVEVVRIIKYSTDWEYISAASLYGANTYIPFDAGTLRMVEYNGYLYVRTCHEMYAYYDGYHHQANMTLIIDTSSMEITSTNYGISNNSTGYVSHSFNQFIIADDAGNIIALDHGDAHSRSIALFKLKTASSIYSYINVFTIEGESGDNFTGVSVGGFDYSSTSYIAAGNSIDQALFDSYANGDITISTLRNSTRNIFVTVTDRNDFTSAGTSTKWITNYDSDSGVTTSTPQLVKIDSNSFLLLWTETESSETTLKYVFLDDDGDVTSEIYSISGSLLSDCKPIVVDGNIVWYVTYGSAPMFCTIYSDGTYSISNLIVTFDSNGGSDVESQTVAYGSTASEPTEPTLTGYTFQGWYTSASGGTEYDFSSAVTESVTLYAHWKINTYQVYITSNGGGWSLYSSAKYGTTITEPEEPTRTGYTFAGWYTEEEGSEIYDFSTPVSSDVSIYAHWTANKYTVTFNSNGGTAVASQTVEYGTYATEPTAPTRTGYTFAGWYTEASDGSRYYFTRKITGDLTLYAHWTINTYTVTFNSNGGTSVSSQTVSYGSTATEPTAPTWQSGFPQPYSGPRSK